MNPSRPQVRAPSDGDHPATKATSPCSPAGPETLLYQGLQEIAFQSLWLKSFLRFFLLQLILHILNFLVLLLTPYLTLTNCSTTELL